MLNENEYERLKKELILLDHWVEQQEIVFPLDEGERIETYKYMSYVLAKIYLRADWRKIAKSPKIRSEDVFQHKLKVAGVQDSIPKFVGKLCNLLSLQNVSLHSSVIDALELDKKRAFATIRDENAIYISRKAIELSQLLNQAYKEGKLS